MPNKGTVKIDLGIAEAGLELDLDPTIPDPISLLGGAVVGDPAALVQDGLLLWWDRSRGRSWLLVTPRFAICLVHNFYVESAGHAALAWMRPRSNLRQAIVTRNPASTAGRTGLLSLPGEIARSEWLVCLEPFGGVDGAQAAIRSLAGPEQ